MRDLSVARFAATFVLYAHMAMAQYSTGWNFTWPVATQQCANVSVSISGGVPPWVVGLMPIGGSPITWRVRTPDDGSNATLDNPVTATIPIQLTAGTLYTVMVTDQIGYAGGSGVSVMNPIGLQRVGESTDASCLTNISPVPQEFTFTTFGNAAACQDDFHIAWQDQVGRSPYSMTVVPLDTSYNPWDVALTGGVIQPDYAWTVNMTAGTKFTLIMTNRNGWGRGGVGQLYEVANGTGTASCVTQQNLGKVTLPLVATAAPLPQTASFTTTILPASAGQTSVTTTNQDAAETTATITTGRINPKESGGDSSNEGGNRIGNYRGEGGSSGFSTAAIAGGVAGGVVALLAAGLLTWFCIRRKRRNTVDKDGYQYSPPMDMNGGPNNPNGTGTYVGKLEPFTMPESNQAGQGAVPEMSYANNAQSHMHTMSPNMPYAPYDNRASIPFPMPVPVHSNSQDGSRDSYGPPPSQTAASSDGQGHEYGSSNGMCPAIRSSGAFGTGFGVAASGTAGAASASSTGNPYTDLKAASPPTFTSPRHLIPQLAPPFAAGSSSPGGAASAGEIGAGNRSDSGVPSNSPPLPTNSPVPGDNRTTHLSQGQSEGGGHPHQSFNFVRHLDGGALEIPEQGETIDLPPEYNDRRPQ